MNHEGGFCQRAVHLTRLETTKTYTAVATTLRNRVTPHMDVLICFVADACSFYRSGLGSATPSKSTPRNALVHRHGVQISVSNVSISQNSIVHIFTGLSYKLMTLEAASYTGTCLRDGQIHPFASVDSLAVFLGYLPYCTVVPRSVPAIGCTVSSPHIVITFQHNPTFTLCYAG